MTTSNNITALLERMDRIVTHISHLRNWLYYQLLMAEENSFSLAVYHNELAAWEAVWYVYMSKGYYVRGKKSILFRKRPSWMKLELNGFSIIIADAFPQIMDRLKKIHWIESAMRKLHHLLSGSIKSALSFLKKFYWVLLIYNILLISAV